MRRVPPPPGARKGAPPPIPKTTVKPVEVQSLPDNNEKVEQTRNKIEKQEPQIVNQLPVPSSNPASKVEEVEEEVPKKVQAPVPRTKPPGPPVKRSVPGIPQKSKPTAPVVQINPPVNQVEEKKVEEVRAPQTPQPEPSPSLKQSEQPKQTKPTAPTLSTKPATQKPIQQTSPAPTPTPPNLTPSKPQLKTTQINTLKSKLDEVLNARSLLLQSSQQSQQQQQQNTDNNNIIPVQNPFSENDDNVSGGDRSDPFEEINQGSNSSSAKEIKEQNGRGEQERVNGATQTIEAEAQQYRNPNYNPFAEQYEKQQNQKQQEKQFHRPSVPQSVQIPFVQLPQAVEQNKTVEKSLEHASKAIKKEQKTIDLKEYIALLRERQREMNKELNNTHNRLVVQEQDYINRIELLKLQLEERNQRIESLKGK